MRGFLSQISLKNRAKWNIRLLKKLIFNHFIPSIIGLFRVSQNKTVQIQSYFLTDLRRLYKEFVKSEGIYALAGRFIDWLEEREREKRRPRYKIHGNSDM